MVRLLPIIAATISISKPVCHGFVTQRSRANDVRPLCVQLEGREIEGALTPTNNFVLVKKAAIEDETEGGILLTGSVSNIYFIGSLVILCAQKNVCITSFIHLQLTDCYIIATY
jgi:hypothetical protein